MGVGEEVVESLDWSQVEVLSGTSESLKTAVGALIGAGDPAEAERTWWSLENAAFAHDTIYGAAEPLVDVLFAALCDDRPRYVRSWIIEVLFFIMKGGSLERPELSERCRSRGRLGLWLLAREAGETAGAERDLIFAVMELIEPQLAPAVRRGLGVE